MIDTIAVYGLVALWTVIIVVVVTGAVALVVADRRRP